MSAGDLIATVLRINLGRAWAFAAICLVAIPAQAQVSKEYQIKAAFIYNFSKFVEWPAGSFAAADSPIVIGVLGKNPITGELERLVHDRKLNGRAIVIKSVESATDATTLHLVFVGAVEEPRFEGIVDVLRAHGVLAVGESPRFLELGGIIAFVLEGDKIRFEINAAAADRNGLKLSAQLLKLATAVYRKT